MITWIQQTFQHHFRVIFTVLLAVTIISFIFTIGAAPGIGRTERRTMSRPFFGLNLGSEEDGKKLMGDASMSVYVMAGYMALDEARMQRYAYSRYATLALADKLHIPAPSDTEIADHIKALPRFANESGQFDPKKYAEFRDSVKKNPQITEGDISRVIADDVRSERVQKLLSGPGYVLPSEIKRELTLTSTSWTLGIASFDYASFNPKITPSEAELAKYFADNTFRYQIPPKVSLSYLEFPATAYLGQVSVTEPEVRSFYDSNPARFPKPTDSKSPQAAPANPAGDYALVRPQVEAALKMERAQRLAAKDASDFAVMLYERKLPFGSPEISNLAGQRNLALKDAPPFAENEVPPALGANPQISEEAFRLNKQRFYSDALPTENGSVILFWKETIAAREPVLADVRAKVSSDYTEEEKRKRFVELGRTLRSQLEARLKTGEAFEKAVESVASAQGLKVEAKIHPAVTLRERPQDIDVTALSTLERLDKGDVSDMVRTQNNKGVLVYAADKKTHEINDSNPQYTSTRAQIAQFTASRNASEYLHQLVEGELAKSEPATR